MQSEHDEFNDGPIVEELKKQWKRLKYHEVHSMHLGLHESQDIKLIQMNTIVEILWLIEHKLNA